MRGCLGFLLFAAAAIGLLAYGLVEIAVPSIVSTAVKSSSLVQGRDFTVEVTTSFEGVLLHGRVDRIDILGQDVVEQNVTIGRAHLALYDASLLDRTFATANGALEGVDADVGFGAPIHLDTILLSGAESTLLAEIDVGQAEATAAIEDQLRAAGVPVQSVTLGTGQVTFNVAGLPITATLASGGGAGGSGTGVSLDAGSPFGRVAILDQPAGSVWRIASVDVMPSGLRITVSIDLR